MGHEDHNKLTKIHTDRQSTIQRLKRNFASFADKALGSIYGNKHTPTLTHIQTRGQTDMQANRQTDTGTDGQANRQTDIQPNIETDKETARKTN